jgi:4-hydroxybenzoate polyprenyltransferase
MASEHKYSTYPQSVLSQALLAVANGQSVKKASADWGIPRSTLRSRLKGSETHQISTQGLQRLTTDEENNLVGWVLTQEAIGNPPTHAQIRLFAQRIIQQHGDESPIGKRWFQGFLRRNPAIRTKRAKRMDSARINGATTEIIRQWFRLLAIPAIKAIKPENRWNMDEAGLMEGQGGNGMVVGSSAKRALLKKQPGSKAWTSFIECVSATGSHLPPLVIFKGKSVQQQWYPRDLKPFETWEFTSTPNGWTSDDTAVEWLKKVFIPGSQPRGPRGALEPRLLILDGHGSHTTTEFMYLCFLHNIYLLFLPPHSSHVLQPLDLSIFSPLKRWFKKEMGFLSYITDSTPIGKENFLQCYRKARIQTLTSKNIISGWQATGLWPKCMTKPLLSPLLLENANGVSTTLSEAQEDLPIIDWTEETSDVVWETPKGAKDIHQSLARFHKLKDSNTSTRRLLFRKIAKSISLKDTQLASQELKIKELEAEVEVRRTQKRRKVETSPNSKFVNIKAIRKAQLAAQGIEEDEEGSSSSEETVSEVDCIEVAN